MNMWGSCCLLSELILKMDLGSYKVSKIWLQQSPPWAGTLYSLSCTWKSLLSSSFAKPRLGLLGPVLSSVTQYLTPTYDIDSWCTRGSRTYIRKEGRLKLEALALVMMKDKRSYSFDYGLVTRTKTAANMPSRALERKEQ